MFDYRKKTSDFSPLHSLNVGRFTEKRDRYNSHKLAFLSAGALAGIMGVILISVELYKAIQHKDNPTGRLDVDHKPQHASHIKRNSVRLDSPSDAIIHGLERKVVIRDDIGQEMVETGNATIKTFPRILRIPTTPGAKSTNLDKDPTTEYTLVGLGLRTVTMFSIQVYLVGFYIATTDIARLQKHLVTHVNPIATTLVQSERESLRTTLANHVQGEELWDRLLQDSGCRSLFRIVPVRDTSLAHMRDAFVTAATSRGSQRDYTDQRFGQTVAEFKRFFGHGKASRGQEILLCRDAPGTLAVMFGAGPDIERSELGKVEDERFSRMLWLNYLAGPKVASEPARHSIIGGIMEFVERPIGTVASQVV